jgi:hypothetical protein
MLKGLIRLAGFLFTAAGFVQVVIDGTRSIAADAFVYTPLGESLHDYAPRWLEHLAAAIGPQAFERIALPALSAPTALVLIVLGLLLLFMARRRPEKIGHPARL